MKQDAKWFLIDGASFSVLFKSRSWYYSGKMDAKERDVEDSLALEYFKPGVKLGVSSPFKSLPQLSYSLLAISNLFGWALIAIHSDQASSTPSAFVLTRLDRLINIFQHADSHSLPQFLIDDTQDIHVSITDFASDSTLIITHLAFAAFDRLILVATSDGTIHIFSLHLMVKQKNKSVLRSIYSPQNIPLRILVPNPSKGGPVSSIVAVAYIDRSIRVVDCYDPDKVYWTSQSVTAVEWSPRGKRLFIGYSDGSLEFVTQDGISKGKIGPPTLVKDQGLSVLRINWLDQKNHLITFAKTISPPSDSIETYCLQVPRESQSSSCVFTRLPIENASDEDLVLPLNCLITTFQLNPKTNWNKLAIMSFTNTTSLNLIGYDTSDHPFLLNLGEAQRPELPFAEEDYSPTASIGFASCSSPEEGWPLACCYTTDGVLVIWKLHFTTESVSNLSDIWSEIPTYNDISDVNEIGIEGPPSEAAYSTPPNLSQLPSNLTISPAVNAFGQATTPKKPPLASESGQVTAFGQTTPLSKLTVASESGQVAAFGQPSPFGQSSPFGQPSPLGQSSPFVKPSGFGQSSGFATKPSSFGQASPFGSPAPAFGKSAFGSSPGLTVGSSQFSGNQPHGSGFAAFTSPSSKTTTSMSGIFGQFTDHAAQTPDIFKQSTPVRDKEPGGQADNSFAKFAPGNQSSASFFTPRNSSNIAQQTSAKVNKDSSLPGIHSQTSLVGSDDEENNLPKSATQAADTPASPVNTKTDTALDLFTKSLSLQEDKFENDGSMEKQTHEPSTPKPITSSSPPASVLTAPSFSSVSFGFGGIPPSEGQSQKVPAISRLDVSPITATQSIATNLSLGEKQLSSTNPLANNQQDLKEGCSSTESISASEVSLKKENPSCSAEQDGFSCSLALHNQSLLDEKTILPPSFQKNNQELKEESGSKEPVSGNELPNKKDRHISPTIEKISPISFFSIAQPVPEEASSSLKPHGSEQHPKNPTNSEISIPSTGILSEKQSSSLTTTQNGSFPTSPERNIFSIKQISSTGEESYINTASTESVLNFQVATQPSAEPDADSIAGSYSNSPREPADSFPEQSHDDSLAESNLASLVDSNDLSFIEPSEASDAEASVHDGSPALSDTGSPGIYGGLPPPPDGPDLDSSGESGPDTDELGDKLLSVDLSAKSYFGLASSPPNKSKRSITIPTASSRSPSTPESLPAKPSVSSAMQTHSQQSPKSFSAPSETPRTFHILAETGSKHTTPITSLPKQHPPPSTPISQVPFSATKAFSSPQPNTSGNALEHHCRTSEKSTNQTIELAPAPLRHQAFLTKPASVPSPILPLAATMVPKIYANPIAEPFPSLSHGGFNQALSKIVESINSELECLVLVGSVCQRYVGECRNRLQGEVTTLEKANCKNWQMGDLPTFYLFVKRFINIVKQKKHEIEARFQTVTTLESAILKADLKKEEVKRVFRLRNDPGFTQVVRTRQLGPIQLAHQKDTRRLIRDVKHGIFQMKEVLQSLKAPPPETKSQRTRMQIPSLDTINRCIRNITFGLTQYIIYIEQLNFRVRKLKAFTPTIKESPESTNNSAKDPVETIALRALLNEHRGVLLKTIILDSASEPILTQSRMLDGKVEAERPNGLSHLMNFKTLIIKPRMGRN
ncbi:hypothetical protein O181_027585 [Austropuccinia psidii MF-1]|uniref:Nucleoporin Nup159/Nup146 N-terminal domain-containing protein n=1 Tax=Austropuccinia psidii MF-1 TaxID=1389203 RepID=A0A9Q3H3C8_9BASI|nr:hypothetical protein [Austropuccinia psidii MF-1]